MQKPRFPLFGAVALAAILAGGLRAQAPSGTLRGQLTDPSGLAVTQATISVTNTAGQTVTANPDKGGVYQAKGLAPGLYTVTVDAVGFATFEQQSVQITAGQTRQLDVKLQLAQQVEKVTVEGEAAQVSVAPENNASAVVIQGKDLEALSDDPDELQSELEALAGPSTGPNGGEIYIDGFTGGQLPPKADIREIRVNQNPFSAEYDRLGYGRIEILTKPGSEKFHGRLMGDFNDSAFNTRNPFAQQIPSYHSEFFDGNLGGPLGKKASFFFDGQRRDIQDAAVVSAEVLGPAPSFTPTPFTQSVLTPQTRTNLSPRVDYQLTNSNTLTVRYQYWNDSRNNQGIGQFSLPSLAYNTGTTEHTLQVSDSQVVSTRTVNDTRFQYRHFGNDQTPLSTDPTVSVLQTFASGGSSGGTEGSTEDNYELQNYTSMALGKHFLRYGVRVRDDNESSRTTADYNGIFTFPSLTAYQLTEQGISQGLTGAQIRAEGGGASQFLINAGKPLINVQYFDFEPYAEDDWRVLPNMTLSLGLRFETQDHIHDHADFAPRVGFAWGLGRGRSPKTVLRAGFGIFYDRFNEDLVLNSERLNGINQQQFIVTSPDFFPVVPPLSALASSSTLPSIYQIDPNLRTPYTVQEAVGVERQLFRNATVSVTYLNAHAEHQLLVRNINAPLPGTFDPENPSSGERPFGDAAGNLYQYDSAGLFNQNQVIANFNIRRSNVSLFGFYSLNYASGNTAGASSFPMNQYDLEEDYGPTSYDVRHRLFMGGSWNLPRGFQVFPFMVANSGQPFNITLGQDLNGNSLPVFNNRPAFATASSLPANVVATRWGTFDTVPLPGETIIPVNFGTGPGQFSFNLRLSKTFSFGKEVSRGGGGPRGGGGGRGRGLGGRGLGSGGGPSWAANTAANRRFNLTFSVSARNLFNDVNLAPPIGDLDSRFFGKSNALLGGFFSSAAANRRIDGQVVFNF